MSKEVDCNHPTHEGYIHGNQSFNRGQRQRVRLTETKEHWATTGRLFFRKKDGKPMGRIDTAIWVLDLKSIRLLGDAATG